MWIYFFFICIMSNIIVTDSACATNNVAVTVSGTSVAASAYEMCTTVQSVTIVSTIKTVGI